MARECPEFEQCIHPALSLSYYESNCADSADSARKMFVNWTQQLGLCQACLNEKNNPANE